MKPLLSLEEVEGYLDRMRGENEMPDNWASHFIRVLETAKAALKVVEAAKRVEYNPIFSTYCCIGDLMRSLIPFRAEEKNK